jgi:hypothetical protein
VVCSQVMLRRLLGTRRHRAAFAVLALFAPIFFAAESACAGPVLQTNTNEAGEIALDARGVGIEQALNAVAEEGGFDVWIQEGVTRPPVNVTVPMLPVEDVLHEILRGRNYALIYDGDGDGVSRVMVLAPSNASRSRAPVRRPPPRKARPKQAPKGAIVVRN